jgi:protoporphyrin/coproporphyrin ferrochelatase
MPSYDAVLLASFGGPEGQDDVLPFLENVTRGRGVPRARLEAVGTHYRTLGGVSPINQQNRELLAALRAELARRGLALPLYWGNRFWDPFLPPALERLHADGHRRVLALVTSAYSSYSGCRAYREDLATALQESALAEELTIDKLPPYFDHPGFVTPFADGVAAALAELVADGVPGDAVRILFTTHSIPTAMADTSGPPGAFGAGGAYLAQHHALVDLVLADVRARGMTVPSWSLVFQSRSGAPHVPWLEPDVNDALRELDPGEVRAVVVVPIGFVSDHIEVIWDLDHEARQTCDELGIRMIRVATPGTQAAFVRGLVDLVESRLAGGPAPAPDPSAGWPERCPSGCCPHPDPSVELPTVAGDDPPPR